jgi:hypothetical protein
MGNKISEIVNDRYVNFEDVQQYIRNRDDHFILLNTLPSNMQSCLIYSTVNAHEEESIINHLIHDNKNSWLPTSQSNSIDKVSIVIYGKNNNDQKVFHKHNQLQNLGFTNVYIYPGGMFEWLLLQDIYGDSEFPTSSNELDLLRYKPSSSFRQKLNPNQNLLMAP